MTSARVSASGLRAHLVDFDLRVLLLFRHGDHAVESAGRRTVVSLDRVRRGELALPNFQLNRSDLSSNWKACEDLTRAEHPRPGGYPERGGDHGSHAFRVIGIAGRLRSGRSRPAGRRLSRRVAHCARPQHA